MQHRRQKGKGFLSFMKKVGGFLKKTKLLSRVGSALGAIGVPYAGTIGSAAGMLGYGGCTHVACIKCAHCILSR